MTRKGARHIATVKRPCTRSSHETISLLAEPADPAVVRSAIEFLERDTMGNTWQVALKDEIVKQYFLDVRFVKLHGGVVLKATIVKRIPDFRTHEVHHLPQQLVFDQHIISDDEPNMMLLFISWKYIFLVKDNTFRCRQGRGPRPGKQNATLNYTLPFANIT